MPLRESKLLEGLIMPDRASSTGKAWRCNVSAIARHQGTVGPHATICAWIVQAAWAHPFWANYALGAIHLRPVDGLPPPKLGTENATHEVLLFALNPDRTPNLRDPFSTRLFPVNFAAQWTAASDIDAEQKIEKCVDEILAGRLSPDTDFRHQWVALFGDVDAGR